MQSMQSVLSVADTEEDAVSEESASMLLVNEERGSSSRDSVATPFSLRRCSSASGVAPQRRWLVFLIVSLIMVVLVVVGGVCVAVGGRAWIQQSMDAADLIVDALIIDPTFPGLHPMQMRVNVSARLEGSFATLGLTAVVVIHQVTAMASTRDSTNSTTNISEVYYPFAAIEDPIQALVNSKSTAVTLSSVLTISNTSLWTSFGSQLLAQSSVQWRLDGLAQVNVGFLSWSDLRISKQITTAGCAGLGESTRVLSLNLNNSDNARVIADIGVAFTNPSTQIGVTSFGRLEFQLALPNSTLLFGRVTSTNFTLSPGRSSTAFLQLELTPSDMDNSNVLAYTSDVISSFMARRALSLSAHGRTCSAPAFSHIVSNFVITTTVTAEVLERHIPPLVDTFSLRSLSVAPVNATHVSIDMSTSLVANSPLGSTSEVTMLDISFDHDETELFFENAATIGRALLDAVRSDSFNQVQVGDKIHVNATLRGFLFLEDRRHISTMQNFTMFVEQFMSSSDITLGVIGAVFASVNVQALGVGHALNLSCIPVSVGTTIVGMSGLQQVRLDSVSLPSNSADNQSVVIAVNVSIYNPSVVSLTLDSPLCMVTSFSGHPVAYVNSSGGGLVELVPGWSTYLMSGIVAPADLESASVFFSQYMRGVQSTVAVKALSSCVPADIPWLRAAIGQLAVRVHVSGLTGFELVQLVEIDELLMDFGPANYSIGIVALGTGTITARWRSPFTFPFRVYQMSMHMEMLYHGRRIARLQLPSLATRSGITAPGSGYVTVSFADIPVRLEEFSGFCDYVNALVLHSRTTMGIEGIADLSTAVAFGNSTLSLIPYSQNVSLRGVDSFQCTGCVQVLSVSLVGGEPRRGYFELSLMLKSEATASLYLGRLSVLIYYQQSLLGIGVVHAANLNVGNNSFLVHATLIQTNDNEASARAFLSNFIQGRSLPVEMHGFENGTDILVAKPAFSRLNTSTVIPGSVDKLVRFGQLVWSWKILKLVLPVRLTVYNPYKVAISITAANFVVSFKGQRVASVQADWSQDPIVIQPQSVQITRDILASIQGVSLEFLRTLIGEIHISVCGTLTVFVGSGFTQTIDYSQSDIPASFLKEASSSTSTVKSWSLT